MIVWNYTIERGVIEVRAFIDKRKVRRWKRNEGRRRLGSIAREFVLGRKAYRKIKAIEKSMGGGK